jgi:hypothetical protein
MDFIPVSDSCSISEFIVKATLSESITLGTAATQTRQTLLALAERAAPLVLPNRTRIWGPKTVDGALGYLRDLV